MKFWQSQRGDRRAQEIRGKGAGAPGRRAADAGGYGQVGEGVTAVLTAADRAAAHIRESALREAEQIRRKAEKQAAATLAERPEPRTEANTNKQKLWVVARFGAGEIFLYLIAAAAAFGIGALIALNA